jgi:hypothetical protein
MRDDRSRRGFKICNDPMVQLAEDGPPSDPADLVRMATLLFSASPVMHRQFSPVGTLDGDPSLKTRCPRIDRSTFEPLAGMES